MNGQERMMVHIPTEDFNDVSLNPDLERIASDIDIAASKKIQIIDVPSLESNEADQVLEYFRQVYPEYDLIKGIEIKNENKYFVHARLMKNQNSGVNR